MNRRQFLTTIGAAIAAPAIGASLAGPIASLPGISPAGEVLIGWASDGGFLVPIEFMADIMQAGYDYHVKVGDIEIGSFEIDEV